MSQPVPVAILGATGYAGEYTTRILLDHPGFDLVHLGSDRLAGQAYGEAVPAFAGATDLPLAADTSEQLLASGAQAIVLAKKSPEVTALVPELIAAGKKIVDIGAEFRLRDLQTYLRWYKGPHDCPDLLPSAVYGLSEIHREAIAQAQVVGNPGCYATSMLLPLIPLLRDGLIDQSHSIVAVGYSGISGAGKRFIEGNNNLFWATNENLHSYKALDHQHQAEVDQELGAAAGAPVHLHFVPHLAPITRGIHTTISLRVEADVALEQVIASWQAAYAQSPFVRIRPDCQRVEVANVAGGNCCDLGAALDRGTLVICSAIDNLIKGASGQAVQNLNIMYGYAEDRGLRGRQF